MKPLIKLPKKKLDTLEEYVDGSSLFNKQQQLND